MSAGRKPLYKVEFIKPINSLRAKVGYGGLNENILNEAQAQIERKSGNLRLFLEMDLTELMREIERARNSGPGEDSKTLIGDILVPAINLKANGGMFGYPLVTRIGAKLIEFLDTVGELNRDSIEVMVAFYSAIQSAVVNNGARSSDNMGDKLMPAIEAACLRYFRRYPESRMAI